MSARPAAGHRTVPHTADVRIEAWAPSREQCVVEAVAAMVECFADVSGAAASTDVRFRTGPASDADLLVTVLDEVIYRLDTAGLLPVAAQVVSAEDGGLDVRLSMAGTGQAAVVGAVPKAVALHELRFGADEAGWSCSVTLDV